jgi:hypothetical protein
MLELLLARGADATAADRGGNSPLHLAVVEMDVGTATVLLEAMGAAAAEDAVSRANGEGWEPLGRVAEQVLHVRAPPTSLARA